MIAELRQKSQLTIPAELVKKFSLSAGDKFDVFEKDGMICLMPVVVYPKKYVDALKAEVDSIKEKMSEGKADTFNNIDDLFKELEEE